MHHRGVPRRLLRGTATVRHSGAAAKGIHLLVPRPGTVDVFLNRELNNIPLYFSIYLGDAGNGDRDSNTRIYIYV